MATSNPLFDFSEIQDVFVGREKESQDFTDSLEAIVGVKPGLRQKLFSFLQPAPAEDRTRPRVFLYYGEGGFGKSRMTRQCIDLATDKKFRIVSLDWDEYYARRSTLPNNSAKMITALYTVLTEPELGIAAHFDEYLKVEKKLEEISKKIERVWKEDSSGLINPAIKAGSALAASQGVPIPAFVQDFAANTVQSAAKEVRKMIIERLRNARSMQREEIDLYENNEKALTEALVNGLARAAESKPILLVIDTYERVDSGVDVDDWMRHVFLKNLLPKTKRVCIVVAGRNNHFQEYRNSLPDALLYNRNFDDILLTDAEILAFARKYKLPLSDKEALHIRTHTAGIPLVVKDTLQLLRDGQDKQQVLQDLSNNTGAVESIISNMVERFLKYTEHEEWKADRLRCYQLVMLRQFDPDLMREAAGLSPAEFADAIKTFASRHSFFDARKHQLHDKVREFLLKYLISQYRNNTAERPFLQEIAAGLLQPLRLRLEALEAELSELPQRYADNRYLNALFDRLLCQIWCDSSRLKELLPTLLTELLLLAPYEAKGFALQLENLAPLFPTSQTAAIKIIYEGIHAYEALDYESSLRMPDPQENRLMQYLQKETAAAPAQPQALCRLLCGMHLVRMRRYDEAVEMLQKAAAILSSGLEEHFIEAFFRLGYAYSDLGQKGKAIECYQKVIEIKPGMHVAWHNMGSAYDDLGQQEKAIEYYEQAIEIRSDYDAAWHNMGYAYDNLGQHEKAIECYQKAIGIKSDYVGIWHNMGYAYDNLGQHEKAIECYQNALAIKPDYDDSWFNLGVAYSYLGQQEKVIECYQKALDIKPDKHEALNNIGIAYCDLGQKEKAIEYYQKAIKIKPDNDAAWNNIGSSYSDLGQQEKAVECYRKAIDIKPDDDAAWSNMGLAYVALDQQEKAIECYQKAIEINPNKYKIWYNLGNAYSSLGQQEKAIECYQKAIDIKPDDGDSWNNMGLAYTAFGQQEKAIECYQKAIEIMPDKYEAWGSIGWIHLLLHQLPEAEAALLKAWELSGHKSGNALMNLGHVCLLRGEREQALNWYRQSLPLWEDREEFFTGMASDYEDLQMVGQGISREAYEEMLAGLRGG